MGITIADLTNQESEVLNLLIAFQEKNGLSKAHVVLIAFEFLAAIANDDWAEQTFDFIEDSGIAEVGKVTFLQVAEYFLDHLDPSTLPKLDLPTE